MAAISDIGVHPLWLSAGIDLHLVPTEVSASQVRRAGVPVRAARLPVEPQFCNGRRARAVATGPGVNGGEELLVIAAGGSLGIGGIGDAVAGIIAAGATAIALTGRNERLRAALQRRFDGDPRVRLPGWTDDLAGLMAEADAIVVNAGGMTCLEALACGVPIVVYRPVAGHGSLNAKTMIEAGVAIGAQSRQELTSILAAARDGVRPLTAACLPPLPSLAAIVAESIGIAPVPVARRR
jgi:UDP-N-acetylglucosamine:LPS N-acetylglucosamine transferase